MVTTIMKLRCSKCMTRVEVAQKSGIPYNTYCLIEKGKAKLSEKNAAKLEPVFGVSWVDLFTKMRTEVATQ